jgi:hypothetical protein
MASWKITEQNRSVNGKISELNGGFSIAMFDCRRVNGLA